MELTDLIFDRAELQSLQDVFCLTHNVYTQLIGMELEELTEFYGDSLTARFFKRDENQQKKRLQIWKMKTSLMEEIVEDNLYGEDVRLCMIPVKIQEETKAFWCVYGVMKEAQTEEIPEQIHRVTAPEYEAAVSFLSTFSKTYFGSKKKEASAIEESQRAEQEKDSISRSFRKNEVLTDILKMLESKKSVTDIINQILEQMGIFLDVSYAGLIRIDSQQQTADLIAQWSKEKKYDYQEILKNRPIQQIPFLTGKPYMVSSDSVLPEQFSAFFRKFRIRAGIALPVMVNEKTSMCLVLAQMQGERIWQKEEIQFLNDIRKVVQSILAKRITMNSLASSYVSLEAILENVGCGIYVKEADHSKILYTNQMLRTMLKAEHQQFGVETLGVLDSQERMEVFHKGMDKWFEVQQTYIAWVDGHDVILGTVYDITDKKNYQLRIEKQANHDFLTGLYNRRRCEEDLAKAVEQAREVGIDGALLYIDLDDFKYINDGLGHQYGDVLIKAIAKSLCEIPGIERNCYRVGGDEFMIIVNNYQFAVLNQVLDEIRTIFSNPWFLKGADYYCTMCMGVVRFPVDGDTVQELVQKADIALYEAKKEGKNRIEYYDDSVAFSSVKRLDMEKNMRNATAEQCNEFEVFYQPIMALLDNENICIGAEALLRWNSPDLGMISPTEFIPLAEYLGLINPIGEYVLREACLHCRSWNEMGHPDYKVNVNLSIIQLMQNGMIERIKEVITETGIAPQNLVLEVTEGLAVNDMGRMKRVLSQIKRLGVLVALDDFGTGYSSLNHMREMPIDIIKIDRCFVQDIGKDDYAGVFVKVVRDLARALNVQVCVEGVESYTQYEHLRDMGINLIQGYYFDRPMKTESFEAKYI